MTTRRLDRYSRVKPSIAFNSIKNGRMLYAESRLERDALYHLEFDDSVVSYVTQPETFSYQLNGSDRVYTPDILAQYRDDRFEYIEVKPDKKTREDSFISKFGVLQQLFRQQLQTSLRLWKSSAIQISHRIPNYQRLYRYRHLTCPQSAYAQLISHYPDNTLSFRQLILHCQQLKLSDTTPLQLIAHQLYEFDLDRPLLPETSLRRAHVSV